MRPIKPVGELTSAFLKRIRCSAEQVDSWNSRTRLLHDLNWCGDDILDAFEILHKELGVDLSNFNFEKFFPKESSMDAYYISSSEVLRRIGLKKVANLLYKKALNRIYSKYPEVTFEMLEEAIKQRKWVF